MANSANSIAELSFADRIWKIAPWIVVVALCGAFAAFSLAQYENAKAKQARELSDVQKILSDIIEVKTGPLAEAIDKADKLGASTDPSISASGKDLASKLREVSSKLFNVRSSLSNLSLADAGMGIIGTALAQGGNDTQRAVGAWAILVVIIMMTAGCFCIILFSKNKPAVGYAIDALKVFGGFFIGVVNTYFK